MASEIVNKKQFVAVNMKVSLMYISSVLQVRQGEWLSDFNYNKLPSDRCLLEH